MPNNVVAFSPQRWWRVGGVGRGYKKQTYQTKDVDFPVHHNKLNHKVSLKHTRLFCLAHTSCLPSLPPATPEASVSALKYAQLPLDLIPNSMRKGVVRRGAGEGSDLENFWAELSPQLNPLLLAHQPSAP